MTKYRTIRSITLLPKPYAEDADLIRPGPFGSKPPTKVQMRQGDQIGLVLVDEGSVVAEGALRACQVCNSHPNTKRTWISFGLSVPGALELARNLAHLQACEIAIVYQEPEGRKKDKIEG